MGTIPRKKFRNITSGGNRPASGVGKSTIRIKGDNRERSRELQNLMAFLKHFKIESTWNLPKSSATSAEQLVVTALRLSSSKIEPVKVWRLQKPSHHLTYTNWSCFLICACSTTAKEWIRVCWHSSICALSEQDVNMNNPKTCKDARNHIKNETTSFLQEALPWLALFPTFWTALYMSWTKGEQPKIQKLWRPVEITNYKWLCKAIFTILTIRFPVFVYWFTLFETYSDLATLGLATFEIICNLSVLPVPFPVDIRDLFFWKPCRQEFWFFQWLSSCMISDELWINNVNSRFEIHFLPVFWPPRTKQWKPLLWQRPVWTKSLQLALAIRPAQRAWPSVTGRNQSQSSKWVRRAEVQNRLFAIGGVKMTKVGASSIDSFSWCLALRPQVPSVFWKLGVRHQVCCWPWYTTPCKMLQLPTKAAECGANSFTGSIGKFKQVNGNKTLQNCFGTCIFFCSLMLTESS